MMVTLQWNKRNVKDTSRMDIVKYLDEHENKDLLRFLTSGSVDDGKSTLIGRLLYDSKMIFDDQLSKLKEDSQKSGNKGDEEIDYSLLLDGLKAEREQGITIDVAYRYFSTPNRKFIIADTPGHEQYTRNMATGASTADLAIILIDARKGVITQTKRHAFINSLLGIKHVVVAVNKMDLVDFSEEKFNEIRHDFEEFTSQLDLSNKYYIPLSALKGDNVVDRSDKTPWYNGETLLGLLETVNVSNDRNFKDFRFPVQYVNRPNLDFRGFSGTVVSGVVKKGDLIKALPSMKESKVKNIVTADGNLDEAFAPMAITLELEDEIDISSGEMIVPANNLPKISNHFESMVVWMHESELKEGKTYLIRHSGKTTKARVDELKYNIDVNTLQKNKSDALRLNEIGRVVLSTTQPLFFDPYTDNRETGSYILIDPISNTTVAAGMIIDVADEADDSLEDHIEKREFQWETGLISAADRAERNNHKGKTVLVTGSKGTGKRDIAKALEKKLFDMSLRTYYLGGSNIKGGLDSDIGSNFVNRDEHIRRLGELSRIMTDAGLVFITTFDSADDYDLDKLKKLNSPYELIVVNIGDSLFKDYEVDLSLKALADKDEAVDEIIKLLSVNQIIPDYCI